MGNISIRLRSDHLRPFPTRDALGQSPDDTMVYVASTQPPGHQSALIRLVKRLNAKWIDVAYEIVSRAGNDCSLSNYTVLRGIGPYFNVEVVHDDEDPQRGDNQSQRQMIDILMEEVGINSL